MQKKSTESAWKIITDKFFLLLMLTSFVWLEFLKIWVKSKKIIFCNVKEKYSYFYVFNFPFVYTSKSYYDKNWWMEWDLHKIMFS